MSKNTLRIYWADRFGNLEHDSLHLWKYVKNKGFSEALFTKIMQGNRLNNLYINDYFTKFSQSHMKDICPNKKSNTALNNLKARCSHKLEN